MRIALLQLNSSDQPAENLEIVQAMVRDAVDQGAQFVLTPEVTNCVSSSRRHQQGALALEENDQTLPELRDLAAELGIWLLIGSLGLKTHDADGRFANRSFMIAPDGGIVARYDKIHMFDVNLGGGESFRESDGYRPGAQAVLAQTDFGPVGMTICYDVRFAYLYRALAKAGARILTVPAAFSPVSGAAHWHALLRARAIETGCFVLAPGQTGEHSVCTGKPRRTYGHSLVVSPWGEVLADAGTETGITIVDLDLADVDKCRHKIPSLSHDRPFQGP